jgi:holo-[acyl-carrier protein] synthase
MRAEVRLVRLSRCKQKHVAPDSGGDRALPDGILGLGVDLCAVPRLERELADPRRGFLAQVFLPAEVARAKAHRHPARALAACFAAKEAVIKALARAGGQGTFWQDIEVQDDGRGRPVVILKGRLHALAHQAGLRRVHVSCAHGRDYATACAIATR